MGTLRKPDYKKEEPEEGVDAFASEDEPLVAIQERSHEGPPRRPWIILGGTAALVIVAILIVARDSGRPPSVKGPALLPARTMADC